MPPFSDRGLGSTFFVVHHLRFIVVCGLSKTQSSKRREKMRDREHLEKSNADDSLTQRGERKAEGHKTTPSIFVNRLIAFGPPSVHSAR